VFGNFGEKGAMPINSFPHITLLWSSLAFLEIFVKQWAVQAGAMPILSHSHT
jgi:hypothetical protein